MASAKVSRHSRLDVQPDPVRPLAHLKKSFFIRGQDISESDLRYHIHLFLGGVPGYKEVRFRNVRGWLVTGIPKFPIPQNQPKIGVVFLLSREQIDKLRFWDSDDSEEYQEDKDEDEDEDEDERQDDGEAAQARRLHSNSSAQRFNRHDDNLPVAISRPSYGDCSGALVSWDTSNVNSPVPATREIAWGRVQAAQHLQSSTTGASSSPNISNHSGAPRYPRAYTYPGPQYENGGSRHTTAAPIARPGVPHVDSLLTTTPTPPAIQQQYPVAAANASPEARLVRSRSLESIATYRPKMNVDKNLQTRLRIHCGKHEPHERVYAYLDSGATCNAISGEYFDILAAKQSAVLDEEHGSNVGSATRQSIEVMGTTKIHISWFDSRGDTKRDKVEFDVIDNLYPHMIFMEDTIKDLDLRSVADTWPRDDPEKGFLMFNTPWQSSATKRQNESRHQAVRTANQSVAEQEKESRARARQGRSQPVQASTSTQNQRDDFLPDRGIRKDVLEDRLRQFFGRRARILKRVKIGEETGWLIGGGNAVTKDIIADLRRDTKKWEDQRRR